MMMMPMPTSARVVVSLGWRLILAAAALSACGLVKAYEDTTLHTDDIVLLSTSPVDENFSFDVKMESTTAVAGFQFKTLDDSGTMANITGVVLPEIGMLYYTYIQLFFGETVREREICERQSKD